MSTSPKKTSARRTQDYRARLRAQGLKPRTIWVFDTSNPEFLARIREGSLRLGQIPSERDADAFIEGHYDEFQD